MGASMPGLAYQKTCDSAEAHEQITGRTASPRPSAARYSRRSVYNKQPQKPLLPSLPLLQNPRPGGSSGSSQPKQAIRLDGRAHALRWLAVVGAGGAAGAVGLDGRTAAAVGPVGLDGRVVAAAERVALDLVAVWRTLHAPAVGHEELKKELLRTGLLDDRELETFKVPKCLKKEKPVVKQHNRGLKTIYNRMMHLRRRYARLMINGRTSCPEAEYISRKLDVYEFEAMLIQDKVDLLQGNFFMMPSILMEEIKLRQ